MLLESDLLVLTGEDGGVGGREEERERRQERVMLMFKK